MDEKPVAAFPHCDQSVLHAPSECHFCDKYPQWQELRRLWGIAFTGHEPQRLYKNGPWEAPCPSDYRRGIGGAHNWHGNRPTNADVPQQEPAVSQLYYSWTDGDEPGTSTS